MQPRPLADEPWRAPQLRGLAWAFSPMGGLLPAAKCDRSCCYAARPCRAWRSVASGQGAGPAGVISPADSHHRWRSPLETRSLLWRTTGQKLQGWSPTPSISAFRNVHRPGLRPGRPCWQTASAGWHGGLWIGPGAPARQPWRARARGSMPLRWRPDGGSWRRRRIGAGWWLWRG